MAKAMLSARGALVSETGKRTGRSPKDKFTVKDAITENKVDWGAVNLPFRRREVRRAVRPRAGVPRTASRFMCRTCSAAPIRAISCRSR